MSTHGKLRFGAVFSAAGLALAAMGVMSAAPASAASSPAVKTIVVGGLGGSSAFGAAGVGAQAYFNQVNASGELKGITIKYIGFTDDGNTPATALSAQRQLVTQDHVFAIVPDMSFYNSGPYLSSQHVPYVGLPLDASYCSNTPTTKLWGFGITGCVTATDPPLVPDTFASLYSYVSKKTGSKHPTLVAVATDNAGGTGLMAQTAVSAKGAGFKVLSAKADIPLSVPDYTPYVQQWMTANGGKPLQVIVNLAASQSIPAWGALKAVGYSGSYFDALGNIALVQQTMIGTVSTTLYNTAPSKALTAMQSGIDAVSPGMALAGFSNVPGYLSASMFVQALKSVGNNDTPQAVQHALATQTWKLDNLAGPITYPKATVVRYPLCSELIADNPTGYAIISPYSCTTKTYKN
jgi:ABC-type branched-subunit amino acid transport system substrate-binding protein